MQLSSALVIASANKLKNIIKITITQKSMKLKEPQTSCSMASSPTVQPSTTPIRTSFQRLRLETPWRHLESSCCSPKQCSHTCRSQAFTFSLISAKVIVWRRLSKNSTRSSGPPCTLTGRCGHCYSCSTSLAYQCTFRYSTSTSCKSGGTFTSLTWRIVRESFRLWNQLTSLNKEWRKDSLSLRIRNPTMCQLESSLYFLGNLTRVSTSWESPFLSLWVRLSNSENCSAESSVVHLWTDHINFLSFPIPIKIERAEIALAFPHRPYPKPVNRGYL